MGTDRRRPRRVPGRRPQAARRGRFDVVGEAADGRAGLPAARATRPDVVLLDVQLPDTDGFRVAAELASEPVPPAVVLVSTRSSDEYGGLVVRSPARGFIAKADLTGQRLRRLITGD